MKIFLALALILSAACVELGDDLPPPDAGDVTCAELGCENAFCNADASSCSCVVDGIPTACTMPEAACKHACDDGAVCPGGTGPACVDECVAEAPAGSYCP